MTDGRGERHSEVSSLQAALRSSSGEPAVDEFLRGALRLGIYGDRLLEQVYREETAPPQAMLDLHLEGPEVRDHATSAARFASFVKRVSEATKFTAKHIAGSSGYPERLLIEGVLPGSVRVILRAPEDTRQDADPHPDMITDNADSLALKAIARVVTNASVTEDDPGSETLLGLIQGLPPSARTALKGAATDVLKAGWDVVGTVRQLRHPEEPVRVTQRGAARLRSALKFNPGDPQTETRIGYFDGLKVSAGIIYFIPTDRGGRAFSAAASEPLLVEVAMMTAERDASGHAVEVQATFEVRIEEAEPGVPSRRSRVLVGHLPLAPPGQQESLDLDSP